MQQLLFTFRNCISISTLLVKVKQWVRLKLKNSCKWHGPQPQHPINRKTEQPRARISESQTSFQTTSKQCWSATQNLDPLSHPVAARITLHHENSHVQALPASQGLVKPLAVAKLIWSVAADFQKIQTQTAMKSSIGKKPSRLHGGDANLSRLSMERTPFTAGLWDDHQMFRSIGWMEASSGDADDNTTSLKSHGPNPNPTHKTGAVSARCCSTKGPSLGCLNWWNSSDLPWSYRLLQSLDPRRNPDLNDEWSTS